MLGIREEPNYGYKSEIEEADTLSIHYKLGINAFYRS